MEKENIDMNIHVLNSYLYLYCSALRPEQMETDVLPLYDKYKIKYDLFTYQNLIQMYLKLRNHDLVLSLYKRLKTKDNFKAN